MVYYILYFHVLDVFDATFYSNHLDVNWHLKYEIHGLMVMLVIRHIVILFTYLLSIKSIHGGLLIL